VTLSAAGGQARSKPQVDIGDDIVPCLVEGRLYSVGPSSPVRLVDGVGYVHSGALSHTTLGDPIDVEELPIAGSIIEDTGTGA
jgi:hypothetical protein